MLLESPILTDRLVLRRPTEADFGALYEMHTDPDVMRFVGGPLLWSREYAFEHHKSVVARWDNVEYGGFHVALRETGEFIGWVALSRDRYVDGIHLGFRFRKEFWGQGYATEAGGAVIHACFTFLGLPRLVSTVHSDNEPARKLVERLGFFLAGEADAQDHTGKVVIYVLDNNEDRQEA